MSQISNKMGDLNNHLFEQLERLNDPDIEGEELEAEIKRSKAMTDVAGKIIENARLAFDAYKYTDEFGRGRGVGLPDFLGGGKDDGSV
jgi:hypothetical protein